jgi:hypothetical protein
MEELLGVKGAQRWRDGRDTAASAKAEVSQAKRSERNRLGTYTAGGRRDEEESSSQDSK